MTQLADALFNSSHTDEKLETEEIRMRPVAELFPDAEHHLLGELSDGEFAELRSSIAAHGIETPLLVTADGRVLDGCHRLRVAGELGIAMLPCRTVIVGNERETEAIILAAQLGRRNLSPVRRDELIGRLYRLRKAGWGGDRKSKRWVTSASRSGSTAEQLGNAFRLSAKSVKNAGARVDLTGTLAHLRGAGTASVLALRAALKGLRAGEKGELLALVGLHQLPVEAAIAACEWVRSGITPAEAVLAARQGEHAGARPDNEMPPLTEAIPDEGKEAEGFRTLLDRLNRIVGQALRNGARLDEFPWNELDAALHEAARGGMKQLAIAEGGQS